LIYREWIDLQALNDRRLLHCYIPDACMDGITRAPVLYMFDGHNIFDDGHATYGTGWHMDEEIEKAGLNLIVVGVECSHEGNMRLDEYSPFPFEDSQYGSFEGKGGACMTAMLQDVIPFVQDRLPILPGRENTWIAGSSGGLMALYALADYSDIFSQAVILSPYLRYTEADMMEALKCARICNPSAAYISWGALEPSPAHEFVEETRLCLEMADVLMDKGVQVRLHARPEGEHCEAFWGSEAASFLSFLFSSWTDV
jgi:predicted alpha/beta superfamily hydrolase